MAVTQVIEGLGQWSLRLRPDVPRETMDRIRYLGHICVSAGPDDPRVARDSLLAAARYVGPLRGISATAAGYELRGSGMAYWLGDEDDKGAVLEAAVTLSGADLSAAITALLPDAIAPGTIGTVPGTVTGVFQHQTPRSAIRFVCDTLGAAWRVNGDGTLDAGDPDELYQPVPRVAIIRKKRGVDLTLRALPGQAELDEDVEDFTTRVVLFSTSTDGITTPSASADLAPALNPFKDIHGNPVVITRLSQEGTTNASTAATRAQLELNRYSGVRDAISLSTSQYDITGDLRVGDRVWVFDPDTRLFDSTGVNEIVFQGERLNPISLVVNQLTWPIVRGMGVAYRDPDGGWLDLTDYFQPETGDTQVVVGGYNRSLVVAGGGVVTPGQQTGANTSVPAAPGFVLPFTQAVYQSVNSTITRAQVRVDWTRPHNTDGTPIFDGAYYELRYRQTGTVDAYQYTRVSFFDTTDVLIQELTPGVEYSFEVRAVDTADNASTWSAPAIVTLGNDDIAPGTPAPPVVAGSRIAVQLIHTLGLATGGEFNLSADLHHLEVHAGSSSGFVPSDVTLLGSLPATIGMIQAQIPAVGTFPVEDTTAVYIKVIAVDEAGNRSGASAATSATAELIDSAHISDLTVSKVTGGTVSADWIVGADIATALSGQRAGLNPDGFYAYDPSGVQTFEVNAATGGVNVTGKLQSANTGRRVVVNPDPDSAVAQIVLHDPDAPDGLTYLNIVAQGGTFIIGRYRESDDQLVGGIALFDSTQSYFGHAGPGGGLYWGISYSTGIYTVGYYGTGPVSAEIGLLVGRVFIIAPANGVVVNYGATQLRTQIIQATTFDPAGANPATVTASTQNSFTINTQHSRTLHISYESRAI